MVAKRGKGDEREETGRKEKKIRTKNRKGGESEGGGNQLRVEGGERKEMRGKSKEKGRR